MPNHGETLYTDAAAGVVYRTRVIVERVPAEGGRAVMECDWPDWATSWPGRLAAAEAERRRLDALLAEREAYAGQLQAALVAARSEQAAAPAPAAADYVSAAPDPAPPAPPSEMVPCPHCGIARAAGRALSQHIRLCPSNPGRTIGRGTRKAAEPEAEPPAEPEPATTATTTTTTDNEVPCPHCGKRLPRGQRAVQHARLCIANPERVVLPGAGRRPKRQPAPDAPRRGTWGPAGAVAEALIANAEWLAADPRAHRSARVGP